jgi:glutamate 5-kinase
VRIVIKVGSHVLTENGSIAKERMLALVELIAELKANSHEVILVSSGAVAAGFTQLPLDRSSVANKQALAAIGQPLNENDTVSIEELVFGDNDRLSAHVAHHFDAELLVILSDIDAFYDKDPNKYHDAKRRAVVTNILEEELNAEHTPNNVFATGGIVTKLQAADFLLKHKREMFLASGFDLSDVKSYLIDKEHIGGTLFTS